MKVNSDEFQLPRISKLGQEHNSWKNEQNTSMKNIQINLQEESPRNIGKFDIYQNLELSQADVHQISSEYKELYYLRISTQNNQKSKTSDKDLLCFRPQISVQSKQIGQQKTKILIDQYKATELYRQRKQERDFKKELKMQEKIRHRKKLREQLKKKQLQQPKQEEDEIVSDVSFPDSSFENAYQAVLYHRNLREQRIKEEKSQKENQEVQQCTFKPKISNYDDFDKIKQKLGIKNQRKFELKSSPYKTQKTRGEILYELSKEAPLINHGIKPSEEVKLIRQLEQCTFTPNIKRLNFKQQTNKQSQYDETIKRIKKAREQQEIKRKLKETGYTYSKALENSLKMQDQIENSVQINKKSPLKNSANQNKIPLLEQEKLNFNPKAEQNSRKYKQLFDPQRNNQIEDQSNEDQQQQPLLFVDINICQDQQERIMVMQGDRSEDLAANFAKKHGLDSNKTNKLKQLLDIQISNILQKIDEKKLEDEDSISKNNKLNRQQELNKH